MERLDICNVIEIEKIRKLLVNEPDLLSLFEILVIICNGKINKEVSVSKIPIERCISPDLSDHSSDDEPI
jgi:hypothetical protein